jgi:Lon protease-like protein
MLLCFHLFIFGKIFFVSMTNFISIFPLGLVVYPGEELNLHIFEPRYKQLINDCTQNKKPFGIPAVLNNTVEEMGTLVEIVEITEQYENGEMDIKTKGLEVFRILEIVKPLPDKLYSGAIVTYPENETTGNSILMSKLLVAIRQLHTMIKVEKSFKKPDEALLSYDVAHHAGLSLAGEYELLQLMKELQRQEYLKQHISKILPVLSDVESLKKKIQLNGHFKNLSGFDM